MMTIDIDKQFLISQKQKGRPGSLIGVDVTYQKKEFKQFKKLKEFEKKRKLNEDEFKLTTKTVEFCSTRDDTEESLPDDFVNNDDFSNLFDGNVKITKEQILNLEDINFSPCPSNKTNVLPISSSIKQRGTIDIMTVKLSSALYRCKISDRDAVHIIIAVAESLGHDVNDIIVNRSSIKRHREKICWNLATEIRDKFSVTNLNALVLHWDGKLLPDLCSKQIVDRLLIIISNNGNDQLLAVPKMLNGTSKSQAEAIYQTLVDWGLTNHVKAMCLNITATNTANFPVLGK
ncbi:uncharacterized protein LOC126897009 [Daktulosphaira vitifoliae]|uniref:uncharacterized protein LOC126897009 n=1 Tax=Daktulosphaira vitifoliae TaxID=58002 RepID=UPI0021AA2D81|nr:uncharacterized protein LOC126897009 [Daktulosphaira vitifoliae]XP_050526289.1 uncharacterized protein LOC126897009 [Daktulosphaira vitifoliae]XP_050526290.1 uncharacterized protein LOC126897009 [Daktulosphaira vitifoliae]XP_050526291.1 uncharacterized protein LOC126897009 [Daktulosphaira vitifoliae]XP_050526292.1 uncharacterized protein LOC126897009 [Daktulosphaira vitifoliae]XP_050526293.1 uncharacterized protein LOC126897009 [Daktulosphaira vitifoliae]XP_050526294.1 uncharacterized prot